MSFVDGFNLTRAPLALPDELTARADDSFGWKFLFHQLTTNGTVSTPHIPAFNSAKNELIN